MVINVLFIMFIGLSAGFAVGAGFVAFLTVLGIIPRLMQLTKTISFIRFYEWGVIAGAIMGGVLSLMEPTFNASPFWLSIIGFFNGIFVGMLAAALTEVLNVIPLLTKRIGMERNIVMLLAAIVFGKVVGSLFHWLYFVDH
ncbi:stage V sporulation protein AB [Bacillus sp. FJAT-47783]|uniref:stage V sporulation protein AB n=1 Tax=Bacillus sp. FJAT-47783 TaxID=2922712 RepID=UPI001FADEB5E|nr:stage V sporulation protein AB [Bacillus sp. FJAT-47783]